MAAETVPKSTPAHVAQGQVELLNIFRKLFACRSLPPWWAGEELL